MSEEFRDAAKDDPDLDPIRGDPTFKQLMSEDPAVDPVTGSGRFAYLQSKLGSTGFSILTSGTGAPPVESSSRSRGRNPYAV
jgi:hypothetical protein